MIKTVKNSVVKYNVKLKKINIILVVNLVLAFNMVNDFRATRGIHSVFTYSVINISTSVPRKNVLPLLCYSKFKMPKISVKLLVQ